MLDLTDFTGIYFELLAASPMEHQRFLAERINWRARLIGLVGGRGVGKTTLLLQALAREQSLGEKTLYLSADHVRVEGLGLYDIAATFFKLGGTILAVDEIHKRANWPVEIKSLYDAFPRARIWFSGSSALHLQLSKADLSRRALYYSLPSLSFREFILLKHGQRLDTLEFETLLSDHDRLVGSMGSTVRPVLARFQDYLHHGAYPFFLEGEADYLTRLHQVIEKVLYEDIPNTAEIRHGNIPILKKILYEIAVSPPYEINIANMARRFETSRNSIYTFLHYLEAAGMITRVLPQGAGSSITIKPAKLFFADTNLLRAAGQQLAREDTLGTIRETFFVNQVQNAGHRVRVAKQGDFFVNETYLFEFGGKSKNRRQIAGERNAYVVRDDIESGLGDVIPLWMFGLLY